MLIYYYYFDIYEYYVLCIVVYPSHVRRTDVPYKSVLSGNFFINRRYYLTTVKNSKHTTYHPLNGDIQIAGTIGKNLR